MSDGNDVLATVAGEATKAIAKDVYHDGLSPTVKAVGGILATPFEVVRALMSPFRYWAREFEARFSQVGDLVSEKLKGVPQENIVAPESHIAVPALQAISYSMDDENLREMYANLLSSSMQKDKKKSVLPSFVDVVKNLSPDEAKILKRAYALNKIPTISAGLGKSDGNGRALLIEGFSTIAEEVGAENADGVIAYLDNLVRLGLLERMQDKFLTRPGTYDALEAHPKIVAIRKSVSDDAFQEVGEFTTEYGMMRMTEFGKAFCRICIGVREKEGCVVCPIQGSVTLNPWIHFLFQGSEVSLQKIINLIG